MEKKKEQWMDGEWRGGGGGEGEGRACARKTDRLTHMEKEQGTDGRREGRGCHS